MWGYRWRGSSHRHTQSPGKSSLPSASQPLASRSRNPTSQSAPAKHTWRWPPLLWLLSERRAEKQNRLGTLQWHQDKLIQINQKPGAGLTPVELWSVVIAGVSHFMEEGGQIPADRYWEHQSHTNPKWTCTNTHLHSITIKSHWREKLLLL